MPKGKNNFIKNNKIIPSNKIKEQNNKRKKSINTVIDIKKYKNFNIEKNTDKKSDMLAVENNKLGYTDYTLETLYLNNHRGSPERIQIDTKIPDPDPNRPAGTIKINTGRSGIGSLG